MHDGLKTGKPNGALCLVFNNKGNGSLSVTIKDNAYGQRSVSRTLTAGRKEEVVFPLSKSFGWYDLSVKVNGAADFEQRFAGRVETGTEGFTDPYMGGG